MTLPGPLETRQEPRREEEVGSQSVRRNECPSAEVSSPNTGSRQVEEKKGILTKK